MYTMEINPRCEEIGVAREAQCSQVAAVAAAPQSDASRIYFGTRLQIFSGGDHVLILAGASSRAAGSFAKRAAVSDAAAVVHGKHHVAAAGQILVHAVRI